MKKMLHTSLVAIIVLFALSVSAQQLPARHPANPSQRTEIVKKRLQQSIVQSETAELANAGLPPLGAAVATNVDDSLALVDLYDATNGNWWSVNANWKTTIVPLWRGVTVTNGRVTSLILENNNLSGTIPASIGNLTALKTLILNGNQLTGTLPSTLWDLTLLENLNLSSNQLTGNIHAEIGNFTVLQELYLNNNLFSGSIPSTIGQLQNIYTIDLSYNNFSEEFPSTISEIPMLWTINLSNNQFYGNILNNLSNQLYLGVVDIANNQFHGSIPEAMGVLEYLTEFNINDNEFTFKDIEPIFGWTNFGNFSYSFTYSPQADVGTGDTVTLAVGAPLRISIAEYTPAEHDVFQWFLNESLLPAEVDSFIAIPAITAGNAGNYRCEITNTVATALTLNSKNFRLEITPGGENTAPVANAGADQTVEEGTLVTLNGTASSDADNDPLTYLWTAPDGITLNDNTLAQPTFTAPEVATSTTYEFSLVVNDGKVNSSPDVVVITVTNANTAPVANAGADQTVEEGTLVTLNGTASSDADSDPLTYLWTAPDGITLNDNTLAQPTFTAPNVATSTTYEFSLVVNDGTVNSLPDVVVITVTNANTAPVANAGADQTVEEGTLVTLNGTASSDADSDPLTYLWTAPDGITLNDNTLAQPTFTAPIVSTSTTYEFSLVVNDGTVNSLPDVVVITVNPAATVPATLTIENRTVSGTECFNAQQTITVAGEGGPVTFENNSVATLIAGQNIIFLPGFHAVAGSNVQAYISDVFCDAAPIMALPEEKSALVDTDEDNSTPGSEEKSIKVFPNPSKGMVSIALSNYTEPALVNVYSLQGKTVASMLINSTVTIDLGHLQKGLYIVKVSSNDEIITKKLMLK